MAAGLDLRISKRLLTRVVGGLALIAVLFDGVATDALAAASKGKAARDTLPSGEFYTMKPFTLPLMKDGVVTEHYTLIVALELADGDKRSEVYHLQAKLRDAMYRRLFQMVTFRRTGSELPPIGIFKRNLSKIALGLAGTDLIKSLLIQQAFKRQVR